MEAQDPMKPAPAHRCSVCHRPVTASGRTASQDSRYFPFCSERCKLIDLGAWLDGDYRIPTRLDEASDDFAADDLAG